MPTRREFLENAAASAACTFIAGKLASAASAVADVPTPHLDAVTALVIEKARTAGLYQ